MKIHPKEGLRLGYQYNIFTFWVKYICPIFLSSAMLTASAHASENVIHVGVLALRGPEVAHEMWKPTADYLSKSITGYQFKIVPVSNNTVEDALTRNEIQFVIANPVLYARLENSHGISRIATLKNGQLGHAITEFGAVIFSSAKRTDIASIHDLKNKSFMAVHPNAFGGWRMALLEFKRLGYNSNNFFSNITWSGFPQDKIVMAVKNGEADAGTVRTHILERMALEGKVQLKEFRILNPKFSNDFPFLHSTQLYPEWSFATTQHTPLSLAQEVAVALLSLPQGSPINFAAHSQGWTVPLNYQPVRDFMKELNLGPFRSQENHPPKSFGSYYAEFILAVIIVCLVAIGLGIKRQIFWKNKINCLKRELSEEKLSRYTTLSESNLYKQYSSKIYHLLAVSRISPAEKLAEILRLGCEIFDTKIGRLDKLDVTGQRLKILDSYSTEAVAPHSSSNNIELTENNGVSNLCLNCEGPLAVNNVKNSEYHQYIGQQGQHDQAFIGIVVYINGKKFGVIYYSNDKALGQFQDWQLSLIKHIGYCASVLLEKETMSQKLMNLERRTGQLKVV